MRIRNTLIAVNLIIAVVLTGTLLAQAQESLFGTWKLNLTKSKYSPGPAPKSTVFKYDPSPDGFKFTGDIVPAQGAARHMEATAKFDGKDYAVKGNPEADTYSWKRLDSRTYEVVLKKGGKELTTNRIVVSPDGKSRTNTETGKNLEGQAVNNTTYFERQ